MSAGVRVSGPRHYRKRPVVIEAMRRPVSPTAWDNAALHRWVNDNGGRTVVVVDDSGLACIAIVTLEGQMLVGPGDFVIRGVKGEFYPCKPDIFEATYEAVEVSS